MNDVVDRVRIGQVGADELVYRPVAPLDVDGDYPLSVCSAQSVDERGAHSRRGAGDYDSLVLISDDWWHLVAPHCAWTFCGIGYSGFHWGVPSPRKAVKDWARSPVAVHITCVRFSMSRAWRRLGASTVCHMVSLVIQTASGEWQAISRALAIAVARSSLSSTTLRTRPIVAASVASNTRPVSISSAARDAPIRRGRW